jgi:hypothetical protein
MKGNRFTVTGPGTEAKVEASGVGLSRATTYASTATRAGREESFYVRDPKGNVVGRADADGHGAVSIFGEEWFAG